MNKIPVGQKILTNVAIVRIKKGGKRFELACYRNKLQDYRNKKENNLSNVLQIEKIFSNVTLGEEAKKNDLKKAFGNKLSADDIIIEILNKGEMQESDLERENKNENLKNDIASLISKMCENSQNGNLFPVTIILKAMTEVNCKINDKKAAKP